MKVIDVLKEVDSYIDKYTESDSIICFRGESADYGESKLTASLFRMGLSNKENELKQLLLDYKISEKKSLLNIMLDSQHYIAISRMLDITFNVLVALYFASCDKNHPKDWEDGYLYIFSFRETFSVSKFERDYEYLRSTLPSFVVDNFKVIKDTYENERVKAQNGGFILFLGENPEKISESLYKKIKVKKEDKAVILMELTKYFNIHEFILFPEKDKAQGIITEKLKLMNNEGNKSEVFSEIKSYLEFRLYELKMELISNKEVDNLETIIKRKYRVLKRDLDLILSDVEEKLYLHEKQELEKNLMLKIELFHLLREKNNENKEY